MPALLRKSRLYDMVSKRLLSTDETWLVQGFPRPEMRGVPDELAAEFPFPSILPEVGKVGRITRVQEQSLLGNSMHVAQVGQWILYSGLLDIE